jgi:outer membrane receptor protein involved in Fe transport
MTCVMSGFPAAAYPAATDLLEEIVVTASRLRLEDVKESPIAVAVVQEERLDEFNLLTMEDISSIIPSVDITTSRQGDLRIRGIGSGGDVGFDSSVSLVIDGITFSRGAWVNPAYFDVAQIEVLKGPQGVYLGKNATAGAIWIRTKGPSNEPEFGVEVGHEFDADQYWVEAIASGPLSETFGARLALRYSEMDGWFSNGVDGKSTPSPEETMARLTLNWDISDNLTNVTRVTVNDMSDNVLLGNSEKGYCPTGSPQPVLGVVPDSPNNCEIDYVNYHDPFAPADHAEYGQGRFWNHESWLVSNELEWTLGPLVLTSISGFSDYEMIHQDDYDYASAPLIYAFEINEQEQINQEFRMLSQFDGNVNVLAGLFYEDTDFSYRQSSVLFAQPFWDAISGGTIDGTDPRNGRDFTWDRTNTQDGESWGAYAEVNWDITDSLRLDLGGRYTDVTKESVVENTFVNIIHSSIFSLRPEGDALTDEYDDSEFSPQVTLSWQPSDDLLVFASYTEAFKAGGFAHGATLQAQTVDDLSFGAESVEGYNLGIKTTLLGGRMFLSAVVYHNDFSDLQQQQFNSETFAFTVANVGSNESQGVDIDLTWDVTDHWQFTGSVAFMDSEVVDYIGTCFAGQTVEQGCNIGFDPTLYDPDTNSPRGAAQVRDGAELAPDTEGTASLYYHTTLGNGFGFSAGLSARYKSSWTPQAGKPSNPSFTRLDASATLTGPGEGWDIRVYSRNLTDKRIYAGSGDIPGTGGTSGLPESDVDAGRFADLSVGVEAPREIGVVLTARL